MILIWKGRGIAIPIIFILFMILLVSLFPDDYRTDRLFSFSLFLTALVSWFIGKKWNEKRLIEDSESGRVLEWELDHSFFWIKMQYWVFPLSICGLLLLLHSFQII